MINRHQELSWANETQDLSGGVSKDYDASYRKNLKQICDSKIKARHDLASFFDIGK